jgi:hypothetical protein
MKTKMIRFISSSLKKEKQNKKKAFFSALVSLTFALKICDRNSANNGEQ